MVHLQRPWWSRVLGTGFTTAWAVLAPVFWWAAAAGGVAGRPGAAVYAALGAGATWVVWRSWNVGVVVDDDGFRIQNLVRLEVVPWRDVEGLFLGQGRQFEGRIASARLTTSTGNIDIGATGFVGRRRRVGWVNAIGAPLLAHGAWVRDDGRAGSFPWRGVQPPRPEDVGPIPASPPGRWSRRPRGRLASAVLGPREAPKGPSIESLWTVDPLRAPSRGEWVAAVLLALGGLAFLVPGLVMLRDDLTLRGSGIEVTAVVTGRPDVGGPERDTRVPIGFTTDDGQSVRTTVVTTHEWISGPTIPVRYDPDDPARVRAVRGPPLPWRIPLLFGVTFVALGVGTMLVNRSRTSASR